MAEPESTGTRPIWILVAVLLSVTIVVPLLVPLYDRADPALLGSRSSSGSSSL